MLMALVTTNQDPSTFTPLSHLLLDNLDLEGLEQVPHLLMQLIGQIIISIIIIIKIIMNISIIMIIMIRKETLVGQGKV